MWLRPSQVKIKYPALRASDPTFLTIDVCPLKNMKTPGRLTSETLINLTENGVPQDVFVKLLQEGLDEHVAGLINWEGEEAMLNLRCSVSHRARIIAVRKAREAAAKVDVTSEQYNESEMQDDEDSLEEMAEAQEQSSRWWWDEVLDVFGCLLESLTPLCLGQNSGCPSSLEETVMVFLDAGFTPQDCAVLREKLNRVVTNSINNYVLRYSIDVPMSCTALLIPGQLSPVRRNNCSDTVYLQILLVFWGQVNSFS